MEARIPIAQGQAVRREPVVRHRVSLLRLRHGIQTDTYKFGLDWAPVEDIRLRGSYQRAVRAANIVELFTAQGFNLFDAAGDPCGAAARDPAASDAGVHRDRRAGWPGRSAALDSPAGQYQFQQGGNPTCTPESSDTYSYGIVFTAALRAGPRDHGRLLRHRDRRHDHDLRRREHAGRLLRQQRSGGLRPHPSQPERPAVGRQRQRRGPQHQHRFAGRPPASTSTRLHRPGDGPLRQPVLQPDRHVPRRAHHAAGARASTSIRCPAGSDTYDCAGYLLVGLPAPSPQWRHRFRTSWQTPWDLDLSFTWRHYVQSTGLTGRTTRCPNRTRPRRCRRRTTSTWPRTGRSRRRPRSRSASTTCWTTIRRSARAWARPATATPTRRPTTPSVATSSCGRRVDF